MSLVEEKNNHPKIQESDCIKGINYKDNLCRMIGGNQVDSVNNVLEEIFFRLGFALDDEIEIVDVTTNAFDMIRVNFLVNGKNYKGCFHQRYGRDCLGFSLIDDSKSQYDYKCVIDINNLENMELLLRGYTLFNNGNTVICKRGYDGVKYVVVSDKAKRGSIQQNISLDVKLSEEATLINKENHCYYSPHNEKSLLTYLSGCSYPIKIDRAYNDLINLSFDGNVDDYPLFDLEVMTIRDRGYDDRVTTDVIKLKDGKLESFGMMHTGKLKNSRVDNVGGAVTFIGGGYFDYHLLVPRKGFRTLKCIRLDEDEDIVDGDYVREVGKNLISMFPADAERMFGNFIENDQSSDEMQINLNSCMEGKQLKKITDTK